MNKVILIILDGFGMSPRQEGNAVLTASTPTVNRLFSQFPPLLLQASAEAVGLPFGEMGNSEVGHLTLGSGRVLTQDFTQINNAIADKSFFKKPAFGEIIEYVKKQNSNLHLAGILTESGVHGSLEHLIALIDLARQNDLKKVFIHLFTDGRDSPAKSAAVFGEKLEKKIGPPAGRGKTEIKIATLCGRYYAMDRDKNWDRTQKAFELITRLKGQKFSAPRQALEAGYQAGQNDENLEPTVIEGAQGLADGDGLIIFNFRADRAIQIAQALTDPAFNGFKRTVTPHFKAVIFTEYDYNVKAQVTFTALDLNNPQTNPLTNCLADVVAQTGLSQLHAAESEKYSHVSYFFNASQKEKHRGEEWLLVPSPKVSSYDQKPAMSAIALTDKFIQLAIAKKPHFALLNFANPDMVGHTGNFQAAVKAIETVDGQLGKIIQALGKDYQFIITADHGNADEMLTVNNKVSKEHSVNPVPLVVVNQPLGAPSGKALGASQREIKLQAASQEPAGLLADVAPTALKIMELKKSAEMTGEALI